MKNKPAEIDINLVPKDPFYDTLVGRVLKWALSAGRYIVIFTELVVIASFATRFTLDRQLTDLNGEILIKQSIAESYGDLEKEFRLAQNKIEEYQKISANQPILENFDYISQVTPSGVVLEELVIDSHGVVAKGTTISQAAFNTLINNLQLSPHFINVTIDKVGSLEEKNIPGIAFSLRATTHEVKKIETGK
jgi:hypothetical protein